MGIFTGERRQWAPEPFIPPFPGANSFGRVTPSADSDRALRVPTVWACVSLLANAVSMLTLETFRLTGGIPARVTDPRLIVAPAEGMSQSEWLHMVMVSLLLRGNAYGMVAATDGMGRPTQIEIQDPDLMKVEVDRVTKKLKYTMNGAVIPTDHIWHVRGFTMPGNPAGVSAIDKAAVALSLDLSAQDFALDFFSGGGIPKAVLKSDQNVNQEQARTIKERLMAATRTREPIVLGQGLDYTQISVNPEESQFLATQQANVAQIARFFGIPAGMVGGTEGGSLTYQNVEQMSLRFLTYGVTPWLKRIKDAVDPLLPQPQYVQFNTAALLRLDAHTQAEVDNMQLAGKTRVPSELRARDGLAPMTAAEMVEADMVPLTVTPNGGAKALPALKLPPGPEAPVPAAEQQNSLPVVIHNHVAGPEVRLEQPITVQPAAPAETRVEVNVEPAAVSVPVNVTPAEVRLEQPIHVAPAEVRLEQPIHVEPAKVIHMAAEQRRVVKHVERDAAGDILTITEE